MTPGSDGTDRDDAVGAGAPDGAITTAPDTERSPRGSRGRRIAQVVLALTAAAAVALALAGGLDGLGSFGGGGEVDPQEIAEAATGDLDEDAQITTLATVHAYLNWVVWGGGDFDGPEFARQIDTAIAAHLAAGNDEVVATLRSARNAAAGELRLVDAHDLVEELEYELRGTDPPGDHPAP